MSEIASAYVSLIPSFKGGASKIESELRGPTESAGRTTGSRFGKVFASASMTPIRAIGTAALGLFAVDKVKDFLGASIDEAREAQKVSALTAQVIKSTGGAANVSAAQVSNLAGAISAKVGVDDEAIQSGANMLLTFKNVRNEAGKGNDVFNQATQTMTDMAASMAAASGGQIDFKSSAIQLGKALGDPVKGMSALARVGVTFDAQQQKTIKHLVETGNTLGAQKLILRELKSEFGGAAQAQATAGDKMSVAWGNLKEQIGTALLPVLDRAERTITGKVIPSVSKFITQMQTGKGAGGDFADTMRDVGNTIKDVAKFGASVVKFFNGLPGPIKSGVVQAAAFSLILVKLRSGLSSLGSAIVPAGARVTELGTQVEATAAKSTLAQTAMTKLGGAAKFAAGVGGMMALTDGIQKTGSAAGTLETTLGAAAVGFSVGGPWGAAIGGGIGLVGSLTTAFFKDKRAAEEHSRALAAAAKQGVSQYKGVVDALTQSLVSNSGAFRRNSVEAAANVLATAKGNTTLGRTVAALKAQGVSIYDIARAETGNVKSRRELIAATQTLSDKQADLHRRMGLVDDLVPLASRSWDDLTASQRRMARASGIDISQWTDNLHVDLGKTRRDLQNQSDSLGLVIDESRRLGGAGRAAVEKYQLGLIRVGKIAPALGVTKRSLKDLSNAGREALTDTETTGNKLDAAFRRLQGGSITVAGLRKQLGGLTRRDFNILVKAKGPRFEKIVRDARAAFGRINHTAQTFGQGTGNAWTNAYLGPLNKLPPKARAAAIRAMRATSTGAGNEGKRAGQKAGQDTGGGLLDRLVKTITTGKGKAADATRGVVNQARTGASGPAKTAGHGIGIDIGSGIAAGITAATPWIRSAAISAVNQAEAAARSRKGADTGSPSKKMIRVGRDMGLGIHAGMLSTTATTNATAARLASDAIASASRVRAGGYGSRIAAQQRQVAASFGARGQQSTSDPALTLPDTVILRVGDYEIEAIVEEIADRRIGAHRALDDTTRRAGRL